MPAWRRVEPVVALRQVCEDTRVELYSMGTGVCGTS